MLDPTKKRRIANNYRSLLKRVADELGLQPSQYDLRFNPGGDAVSGEVILHADSVYIQASHDMMPLGVLVRYCKGRKDYTGGVNRWAQPSLEYIVALARIAMLERR